jgi:hypothetical protein
VIEQLQSTQQEAWAIGEVVAGETGVILHD